MNTPTIQGGKYASQERRVRDELVEWYATTPDAFAIDWSDVEIRVSSRMTKAFGNARRRETFDGMEYAITISLHSIESAPWDRVAETIRHEAIHIWQYQELGDGDHGASFHRWADEFDCTANAERPAKTPKFLIVCESCGNTDGRQVRSKVVKKPHRYRCECGGDLRVEKND